MLLLDSFLNESQLPGVLCTEELRLPYPIHRGVANFDLLKIQNCPKYQGLVLLFV